MNTNQLTWLRMFYQELRRPSIRTRWDMGTRAGCVQGITRAANAEDRELCAFELVCSIGLFTESGFTPFVASPDAPFSPMREHCHNHAELRRFFGLTASQVDAIFVASTYNRVWIRPADVAARVLEVIEFYEPITAPSRDLTPWLVEME